MSLVTLRALAQQGGIWGGSRDSEELAISLLVKLVLKPSTGKHNSSFGHCGQDHSFSCSQLVNLKGSHKSQPATIMPGILGT